jgi:hypothetical protein
MEKDQNFNPKNVMPFRRFQVKRNRGYFYYSFQASLAFILLATDMEKQNIHACGDSYLRITVSFDVHALFIHFCLLKSFFQPISPAY